MTSARVRVRTQDAFAWLFLCKGSVVRWPFLRFAGLSIAAVFSKRDSSRAPLPALILRVGVAGHLELPEPGSIEPLIDRTLSALQQALTAASGDFKNAFGGTGELPGIECRLISQLAAGADQMVADRAVRCGYRLQCPLPVDMKTYAEDLRRNPGFDADPAGELTRLAAKAIVLELDGEVDPQTGNLTNRTYENSSLTMLGHADLLIALVRSDALLRPGGTRWLMEEAERRCMPVIEILLDKPENSVLVLGSEGARRNQSLSTEDWAVKLVRSLVLPQPEMRSYPPSGWFEEKFRSRVKAIESEWPPNWTAGGGPAQPQVSSWVDGIRRDYFGFWRWAEHRANTYRDLYQGAYVTISLLGLVAVVGALLGALNEAWSPFGKAVELAAIAFLLLLWRRAHSRHWRQRWLGYRLLEQQINNAAVLESVGRTIPTVTSPQLQEFQKEGAWTEWYLRAVVRQANLPAGKLDSTNMIEAGKLILAGKIDRQIRYYQAAIDKSHDANHRLEMIAVLSLVLTVLTAAVYLFVHYYAESELQWPAGPFRLVALAAGICFPALAATLAAIRGQGEFLQLETRYKGMLAHLQDLRGRFALMLTSAESNPPPLLSSQIARYTEEAAAAMLDEVNQWRSLLYTHEIER